MRERKLSAEQLRLLAKAPETLAFWRPSHGHPHLILDRTMEVLRTRGLIEVLFKPPRWSVTDKGRALLASVRPKQEGV